MTDTSRNNDGEISSNFRLGAERFLLDLAVNFQVIDPGEIERSIQKGLRKIREFAHADRCYIYSLAKNNTRLSLAYQSMQDGHKPKIPMHDRVDNEDFEWLLTKILAKEAIYISSTSLLPVSANTIRVIMDVEKTRSMMLAPLVFKEDVVGIIGLDSVAAENSFDEQLTYLLCRSSGMFAGLMHRQKKEKGKNFSEDKYQNLFANVDDIVFISTPQGKFVDVNAAGLKKLGYDSVEEIRKIDIEQGLYLKPEKRSEYINAITKRGYLKDYKLQLRRKDGKVLTVLETSTVIRDADGEITGYQGIMRDVTGRSELEHQLFTAQKLESVGLLAGGIAHDFNNILTTVNGYAELIRMDMDEKNPHYRNIINILNGSKRAENLIKQLLAFSRRQMIEPKIVNLNNIISELHSMLDRLITDDINFILELKDTIANVKADPIQIQQMLVNLVVNAGHAISEWKNSPAKKEIKISTGETSVSESDMPLHPGLVPGNYILLEVADTGSGMDTRTQQKIFEPFYSTKKEGEGTGLGLSTVYGIIKQNNGFIYVDSAPGKGALFSIYWPVSENIASPDTRIETKLDRKPRRATILFVEDDIHVRELLSEALNSFGHQVFEADNGVQAIKLVKKEQLIDKLDLLISDIVMPEMGGEELAKEMQKLNPSIKIILCSGYTDSRIMNNSAYQANGIVFLAKPYSLKRLENEIRNLINSSS